MSEAEIDAIKNEFKEKIERELKIAFDTKPIEAGYGRRIGRCLCVDRHKTYKVQVQVVDNSKPTHHSPLTTHDLRFIDAIKEGLVSKHAKTSNLILMGQDIAEYGGAFKITEGFLK